MITSEEEHSLLGKQTSASAVKARSPGLSLRGVQVLQEHTGSSCSASGDCAGSLRRCPRGSYYFRSWIWGMWIPCMEMRNTYFLFYPWKATTVFDSLTSQKYIDSRYTKHRRPGSPTPSWMPKHSSPTENDATLVFRTSEGFSAHARKCLLIFFPWQVREDLLAADLLYPLPAHRTLGQAQLVWQWFWVAVGEPGST